MTENPNNNANVFDPLVGDVSRIRLGSVGQSAPGCTTRLHLQDPVDGIGEVGGVDSGHRGSILPPEINIISAANRLIGVVQSRRRPLLGPSPG